MIGLSALATGYRVIVVDPNPDCPAACIADAVIVAPYDDPQALSQLAEVCDRITYEFENAEASALDRWIPPAKLPQGTRALRIAQHRLREKQLAVACGIPTPSFVSITSRDELLALNDFPILVKTCRFGYDGKGQWLINDAHALQSLAIPFPGEYIAEAKINFTREIAVTLGRFIDGVTSFDPIETVHEHGILRCATSPAILSDPLRQRAITATRAIADALDYVGVLCVEYFVCGDELYFNEIAPRPHNSAHATIEGYTLSQYDLHVAAITGSPCVPTHLLQFTHLENILGQDEPHWRTKALALPQARIHLYGKHDIRPGRKLGHVVLTASTRNALNDQITAWRNA
jgi:5-(carboxyamino)imidazole ribonucleotide synthase